MRPWSIHGWQRTIQISRTGFHRADTSRCETGSNRNTYGPAEISSARICFDFFALLSRYHAAAAVLCRNVLGSSSRHYVVPLHCCLLDVFIAPFKCYRQALSDFTWCCILFYYMVIEVIRLEIGPSTVLGI